LESELDKKLKIAGRARVARDYPALVSATGAAAELARKLAGAERAVIDAKALAAALSTALSLDKQTLDQLAERESVSVEDVMCSRVIASYVEAADGEDAVVDKDGLVAAVEAVRGLAARGDELEEMQGMKELNEDQMEEFICREVITAYVIETGGFSPAERWEPERTAF
jgi:hypothetical protein